MTQAMTQGRRSDAALRRFAALCFWGFVVVDLVAPFLLVLVDTDELARALNDSLFTLIVGGYPLTGWLVLRRQPRNRLGWVLLTVGLVWAFGGITDVYVRYGLVLEPGSLPGAAVAATLNQGVWAPGIGLMLTHLILRYPDGHLPGPRWRWAGRLASLAIACLYLGITLEPGPMTEGVGADVENPLGGLAPAGLSETVSLAGLLMLGLSALLCAAGLIVRFRRSQGLERQQLKWLAAAAALVASLFAVSMVITAVGASSGAGGTKSWWAVVFTETLPVFSFALIPVAIGIAILRHRLYDIDVVIKRTLVYGSLTLTLALVYLGLVLSLRAVPGTLVGDSDLAVAASTLAIAGLFGPLRRRIQTAVDHRFFRRAYDAGLTLDDFTDRLRQQVDLESVTEDLRVVVAQTMQPTQLSLWLREESLR